MFVRSDADGAVNTPNTSHTEPVMNVPSEFPTWNLPVADLATAPGLVSACPPPLTCNEAVPAVLDPIHASHPVVFVPSCRSATPFATMSRFVPVARLANARLPPPPLPFDSTPLATTIVVILWTDTSVQFSIPNVPGIEPAVSIVWPPLPVRQGCTVGPPVDAEINCEAPGDCIRGFP